MFYDSKKYLLFIVMVTTISTASHGMERKPSQHMARANKLLQHLTVTQPARSYSKPPASNHHCLNDQLPPSYPFYSRAHVLLEHLKHTERYNDSAFEKHWVNIPMFLNIFERFNQ